MSNNQPSVYGAIVVDTERCKGCNLCIEACKLNLITLSKLVNRKGYHYADQTTHTGCTSCKACAICCPDGCITVYRKK